jgi:hypothetical protein
VKRVAAALSAVGRHRLFSAVFCLGLILRVITMLGFRPAIWFGGDSASYISTGLRLIPGTSRLAGYGLMLAVLRPLHSFYVVTAVQHLMGLAMGVMIYALLRRYGLPAWGATLATLPVLLSAYQLEIEHEILPSAAFGFFITLAVVLTLWWRGERPVWATVSAATVLAVSFTFWPVGLPILVLFLLYAALRRVGWRALTAGTAAAAVPLAGYMLWFNHTYHHLTFSYSNGIYLWSRTMTFANCAVIKPPPSLRPLCPNQPVAQRPAASTFIWEPDSPLNNVSGKKFSAGTNALAMSFARRAILAQPGGYAADVLHDTALSFAWNIPDHPSAIMKQRYEFAYATQPWIAPSTVLPVGRTVAQDQRAYGGETGTRALEPFAGWMRAYQRFAYVRGTLVGVLLLIGLGGIIASWRRRGFLRRTGWGGAALFPWLASVSLLLVPVMTADFSERYALLAVPTICLAAALAFTRTPAASKPTPTSPAASAAAPGPPTPEPSSPVTPPARRVQATEAPPPAGAPVPPSPSPATPATPALPRPYP